MKKAILSYAIVSSLPLYPVAKKTSFFLNVMPLGCLFVFSLAFCSWFVQVIEGKEAVAWVDNNSSPDEQPPPNGPWQF